MSAAPEPAPIERVRLLLARGRLARETVGVLVLSAGYTALNLVIAVVLARGLGKDGFGAFAFAITCAGVLAVLALLGLHTLVVRELARYRARSRWQLMRGLLQRSERIVLASSVGAAGVAAVVGWLVLRSALIGPFWIALVSVPLLSLTIIRQSAMQGLGRVVRGRLPETIVMPLLLLFLSLLAWSMLGSRFSAAWAAGLFVTAILVAFLVGTRLLRRSLPRDVHQVEARYEARAWLQAALPLFLLSAMVTVNGQIGTIMLGLLGQDEAAPGIYNIAARAAAFVSFVYLAASYVVMPEASRLWALGESRRLQRLLTASAKATLLFGVTVALVLTIAGRELLTLLFGSGFGAGANTLRLLVLAELFNVFTGYAGLALIASGRERITTAGGALGLTVNIVLNLVLVPGLGTSGAALAAIGAALCSNSLAAFFLWRTQRLYSPAYPTRMTKRDASIGIE
jgi:O-antigen/teichoic acid export membrane protein